MTKRKYKFVHKVEKICLLEYIDNDMNEDSSARIRVKKKQEEIMKDYSFPRQDVEILIYEVK